MKPRYYDVFLSHRRDDKTDVKKLARKLKNAGISPFLDEWNLVPGERWQPSLEEALNCSETCAVFIGSSGMGPWQHEEMLAAIERRVSESGSRRKRSFRVIPVLLPGAERVQRSRLPTFLVATTWVEFRNGLSDGQAFHRLLCGIRGEEPGDVLDGPVHPEQCPYRGLEPFQEEHSHLFFGREALTEWLISELRPIPRSLRANRFLAVVGASGSGKSSLVFAGLVPAVRRGLLPDSAEWPIALLRPGPDPMHALAEALTRVEFLGAEAGDRDQFVTALSDSEVALHGAVRAKLRDRPSLRLLLIVDQFEELFARSTPEADSGNGRVAFIRNLLYAAMVELGQTTVVLTMRADFYGDCAAHSALAAAMSEHNVLVGPMNGAELHRAIERPALLTDCEFEPGLVDVLLTDVFKQPGSLPLLQRTLFELWLAREGRRLTHFAYAAIGRLDGALEKRANEVYSGLSDPIKDLCRRLFLRLVEFGESVEDAKRRVRLSELMTIGDPANVKTLIDTLTAPNVRLLVSEGGDRDHPDDVFLEVAHDALIKSWSRLRKWIESDRAGLRAHRRLTESAAEWAENQRKEEYLLSCTRLAAAIEWNAKYSTELNQVEREYLAASNAAEEQRKADALKSQRAALMDNATDAIIVADLSGQVSYFNRAAEQLFDVTAVDVQYRSFEEVLRPHDPRQLAMVKETVLMAREWNGVLQCKSHADMKLVLESRWALIKPEANAPEAILIFLTDVTARMALEAQLRHAQRVESIGLLASGIAHDFNNLLAPILMAGPLLRDESVADKGKLIDIVESSARRGANLVRQILSFSRRTSDQPRMIISVAVVIGELKAMLEETFPKEIKVELHVQPDLWHVVADRDQLFQVLLNLCVNARDAMPVGGTLGLAAANVWTIGTEANAVGSLKRGPHVEIRISDTGEGIPVEIRDRIFDPFFTTKQTGHGSGLGLSTALGIVHDHNGKIDFTSDVGAGSCFSVSLPGVQIDRDNGQEAAVADLQGRGETILLVDDEPAVLALMVAALNKHGYRCDTARDGVEASEKYGRQFAQIAAVITDLAMPKLDGRAFIANVKAVNPDAKILVITGQSAKVENLGVNHILQKPFAVDELLSKLRAVIGHATS